MPPSRTPPTGAAPDDQAVRYRAPWLERVAAEGYTPRDGASAGPTHVREVEVRPETWDEESRTLEIVWTTGAAVTRRDWWTGERWVEELSLEADHVRLGRLNGGAPLLDSHWSYGTSSVIGVVVDGTGRIEDGRGLARVRLSRAPGDADITGKIIDGIIRSISVGYVVNEWLEVNPERKKGEAPIYRAIDWEPLEVSAVSIPADAGSGFRGASRNAQERPMPPEKKSRAEEADETCPECEGQGEDCTCDDEAARAAKADAERAEKERVRAEERARIRGIESGAEALGLDKNDAEVRKLVDEAVPLGKARSRLFELAAERDGKGTRGRHGGNIEVGTEERTKILGGFENALAHRLGRGDLTDVGRPFRGLSLGEMARMSLVRAGRIDSGASIPEVAQVLFERSGMHSGDDFPILLSNVANKSLRDQYQRLERTFVKFGRRTTLKDFKQVTRTQLGEGSKLKKKLPGAEIKFGTIGEAKEQYALATYAGGYMFTREMLIDDDLDAFSRLPSLEAAQVVDMENLVTWEQITSNPTMGDGKTLFHADHKNLASAAAPGATALNAGRKLMRTQTGVDGAKIRLRPRFIFTPEAQLGAWEQLYSPNYKPTAKETAMTDDLLRLEIIAEPLLDDVSETNWYLGADPAVVDTLEYAYLQGAEGPQMASEIKFGVGMWFAVFEDFAAKVIEWRAFVKNPYAG